MIYKSDQCQSESREEREEEGCCVSGFNLSIMNELWWVQHSKLSQTGFNRAPDPSFIASS